MLVGHSQGGIDVPGNVQMLSLENENDIVPHLEVAVAEHGDG